MESFFLAETTKYLYLLFDPDNFLHNNGSSAVVADTPRGPCVLHAGGYVFNTGQSTPYAVQAGVWPISAVSGLVIGMEIYPGWTLPSHIDPLPTR